MKKAQSSFDFLVTYGWAIFILLGAIAAFSYFIGFDFSKNMPESCNFGSDFSCKAIGNKNGTLYVELNNFLPKTINISHVEFSFTDGTKQIIEYHNASIDSGATFTIKTYESAYRYADFRNLLDFDKDKEKFDVTIYYKFDEEDALPKTSLGTIVSIITENTNELETLEIEVPIYMVSTSGQKVEHRLDSWTPPLSPE